MSLENLTRAATQAILVSVLAMAPRNLVERAGPLGRSLSQASAATRAHSVRLAGFNMRGSLRFGIGQLFVAFMLGCESSFRTGELAATMPRILTVDDSATVRKLIRVHLQRTGLAVVEASNGAEGLKVLAGAQFDLIIVDLEMPVMNGIVMLRMKDSLQNKTPVILLTAEVNETLAQAMTNPCVMDYVKKPLQPGALRAAVAQVLGLANESA